MMKRWLIFVLVLTCLLSLNGRNKNGTEAVAKMTEPLQQDNLKRQLVRLGSEHGHERDKARDWFLDHPEHGRPALLEIIQAGDPVHLVREAIYLLGQMGNERDVSILDNILKRGSDHLTWHSAQALGKHPSKSAVRALLDALKHKDPEVVGAAAVALGVRRDETTRKLLEEVLTNPDEGVRYRAVYALQKLGVAPSADVLRLHREREKSADVQELIDKVLKEASIAPGT